MEKIHQIMGQLMNILGIEKNTQNRLIAAVKKYRKEDQERVLNVLISQVHMIIDLKKEDAKILQSFLLEGKEMLENRKSKSFLNQLEEELATL